MVLMIHESIMQTDIPHLSIIYPTTIAVTIPGKAILYFKNIINLIFL